MHNSLKVIFALVLGSLLGLLVNLAQAADSQVVVVLLRWVIQPVGELFLTLLFVIVVPLVVSALIRGVVEAGRGELLGKMGLQCLWYTFLTSVISVFIGITFVSCFSPGSSLPEDVRATLFARTAESSTVRAAELFTFDREQSPLVSLIHLFIPRNPFAAFARETPNLLHIMFFSLILGIGAATVSSEKVQTFLDSLEGLYEICVKFIDMLMRHAHYAVGCLVFQATIFSGIDLMITLGAFVATVLIALLVHALGTYSLLLLLLAKMDPRKFFSAVKPVVLTAFATSSSAATLPTSLWVAEENLHIPRHISSFVLTVGATANQNGTALFEGIAVLFLAQVAGIELSLLQQGLVMCLALLGGLGSAAVPSGSMPFIAGILGLLEIPPSLVGLLIGVDRILDMCRTAVNVIGDMVIASLIHASEKRAQQ